MATPRTTPWRALFVPLLAAAAVLGVLPVGVGSAEPRPSLREVERRVNALNAQADGVVEAYSESKLELAQAKRKAALAQGRVRAARKQLEALQRSMYGVAAAAYRSGGTDQFVQLVSTSTPQTFLDRAASLNRIAAAQSAQLAAANTARHRLSVADAEANRQTAVREKVERRLQEQKRTIESLLSEQRRLLSSLRAEERARLEAARRAAAERATRSRASVSSGPVATYTGPASGRAGVAVREAYRKLGSPYQWGASGPNRFDCSGLTMWVWGKAGVSLPHSSRAQYSSGRKVSRSNLQPGDLVYYGSPIHHVGIYIGGGKMISAPRTGDVVKIQRAFRSDYTGATRP